MSWFYYISNRGKCSVFALLPHKFPAPEIISFSTQRIKETDENDRGEHWWRFIWFKVALNFSF